MRLYDKTVVENAVSYIAREYKEKTNSDIDQVVLYKILAFTDVECVRSYGKPLTRLDYYAERKGPVPHDLKDLKSDLYEKRRSDKNNGNPVFICTGIPNLDYFSDSELDVLDKYIGRAVNENWTAEIASDLSHKEIKSYQVAVKRKGRSKHMDYADEFGEDFKNKSESEMSSAEANYALYAALTKKVVRA